MKVAVAVVAVEEAAVEIELNPKRSTMEGRKE